MGKCATLHNAIDSLRLMGTREGWRSPIRSIPLPLHASAPPLTVARHLSASWADLLLLLICVALESNASTSSDSESDSQTSMMPMIPTTCREPRPRNHFKGHLLWFSRLSFEIWKEKNRKDHRQMECGGVPGIFFLGMGEVRHFSPPGILYASSNVYGESEGFLHLSYLVQGLPVEWLVKKKSKKVEMECPEEVSEFSDRSQLDVRLSVACSSILTDDSVRVGHWFWFLVFDWGLLVSDSY